MAVYNFGPVKRAPGESTITAPVTTILYGQPPTSTTILAGAFTISVDSTAGFEASVATAILAIEATLAPVLVASLSAVKLTETPVSQSTTASSTSTSTSGSSSSFPSSSSSFSTATSTGTATSRTGTASPTGIVSTKHTSSSGVKPGAVAGISIATFIFGIALALLGFWFCMNRRKHSASGRSRRSHGANGLNGDKAEGIPATNVAKQSLLDPVDDSTLKSTMAKLDNFIDQHVLGHYHEDQIQISSTQLTQAITDCNIKNSASGMPADELVRLLINPTTRFHTIRRFIAWAILSNTNLDAQAASCLLPPFIVAFYNSFPPIERQAGCEEAFETALTNWKHISAFLLVPNRSFREDPKLHESQIRSAIDQNVKLIHYVLAPFLTNSSKHGAEWEKNLRAIILAGAELGFTLFSQQSNWIFDWKAHSKSEAPVIVVFPALLEKVKGRTQLRMVSEAVFA